MRTFYQTVIVALLALHVHTCEAGNNSIAFIYGPDQNCTFHFRDTAGTRTFTPNTFFWSFGDGSSASSQHATHTYSANGVYQVYHIISDGTNTDTAKIALEVTCLNNLPLKSAFTYQIFDTINTHQVYFYNHAEGKPIAYEWLFGDGDYSTDENPVHTYTSTGTYEVIFKVFDGQLVDSSIQYIIINAFDSCTVFNASFYAYRDTNCKQMIFVNNSHYTATSYTWDFGDNNNSSQKNPAHLYSNTGSYQVKLYATSSKCADSSIQTIKVACRSCYTVEANIDLQVDSANPSKAVLYNYSSGPISGHYWNFGDGNSSTAASPMHTYTSPGNILLTYVVTDTSNCKDTAYLMFTIDSLGHIKRGNITMTLQVVDRTNGNTNSVKQIEDKFGLKIYPQPAKGWLVIESEKPQGEKVEIFDLLGKSVQLIELNEEKTTLDVSGWKTGIYILRIQETGLMLKILIE